MLMQALPALVERDIEGFGDAIGELQRITGDYFSPAQGGRFSSRAVAEALAWLESQGIAGVGQSSWGPTGFAIMAGEDARWNWRGRRNHDGAMPGRCSSWSAAGATAAASRS